MQTGDHVDWSWLSEHDYNNSKKGLWYKLFGHLFAYGERAKPTQKWLKALQIILDEIGLENFQKLLLGLEKYFRQDDDWYFGKKSEMLRGLIWATTLAPSSETYQFLRYIIEKAFKKVYMKGPFSQKVGQAGINALVALQSPEAMGALIQMKSRSKYPKFIKTLDKALAKLSEVSSFSEDEMLDRMTLDYGIEDRGFTEEIGDYTAQIYFLSYNQILWEWLKPDGKIQKSVPAIVKKEYAQNLNALKNKVNDAKQTLQAQRHRLENSWRIQRQWKFEDWKKYIFDHALLSILTQNLIWEFQNSDQITLGIGHEVALIDIQGNKIFPEEHTQVRLWHPVTAQVDEVLAWRDYLLNHQIKQPFKQAFREVYALTSAEQKTYDHSNRFSAHILKQNVLWALSQQRDWKLGRPEYFGHYATQIALPQFALVASLDLASPSTTYVSTQRLRFIDQKTEENIPLENVDTVIFSEIMRDVDLFIALSSIGNDPNWDGSPDYEEYWMDYSFGEKSEGVSARHRKEILEKVIPNTKIASKCSFEGNFLIVKGKIHHYKINIGSSNILMMPQNEYLCIIPDRRAKNNSAEVFLPFDGDSLLSLILSKAFLLVEDDKIEDPAILSQLHKP